MHERDIVVGPETDEQVRVRLAAMAEQKNAERVAAARRERAAEFQRRTALERQHQRRAAMTDEEKQIAAHPLGLHDDEYDRIRIRHKAGDPPNPLRGHPDAGLVSRALRVDREPIGSIAARFDLDPNDVLLHAAHIGAVTLRGFPELAGRVRIEGFQPRKQP